MARQTHNTSQMTLFSETKPDFPPPIWRSPTPWRQLIDELMQTRSGEQLLQCAWVVPRIEHVEPWRQAMGELMDAQGLGVVDSPCIISVDRLSELPDQALALRLLTGIDEVLAQYPDLIGGLGPRQRWKLSQEYLELARQFVLAAPASESVMTRYKESAVAAGPEASVIQTLAQLYKEELTQLLPSNIEQLNWQHAQEVIWIWDGEPIAQWWLDRYAHTKTIHCINIRVESDQLHPWVEQTTHAQLLMVQDAEQQAHAAAQMVLEWLHRDQFKHIAVAVVDRVLARRLRAKLEASGVLIDDRTGWRLSTTRSATWVTQWIALSVNVSAASWLGVLQAHWLPHCQWITDPDIRASVWKQWIQLGESASWQDIDQVAQRQQLEQWQLVSDAVSAWLMVRERSLSQWANALLELLDALGCLPVFLDDKAGDACVQMLRMLARSQVDRVMTASQFNVIWEHSLEQARFRPQDVTSPVRLLPLLSMRLQRFDAVLVLGCAQKHFVPSPPGLLPPAVAAELGLPGPMLSREQQMAAVVELMSTHQHCVLTAAHTDEGQPSMVLSLLSRVGLYWKRHATMRSIPWDKPWALPVVPLVSTNTQALDSLVVPSDKVSDGQRYPVSAMGDLAACPLRFALTRATGWQDEPSWITDRSAGERGDFIHHVIETFHRQNPYAVLLQFNLEQAVAAMNKALQTVWSKLPVSKQKKQFVVRWEFLFVMTQLADALLKRAKAGWEVSAQELPKHKVLQWGEVAQERIEVEGRIDRFERQHHQGDQQALAVIDIKTGSINSVKKQASDPASWPQLSAYQWLLDAPDAELSFLHVDKKKVNWLDVIDPEPNTSWAQEWATQTSLRLSALANGAPAEPNPGDMCTYCKVAGSCRAGWWATRTPLEASDSDDDEQVQGE